MKKTCSATTNDQLRQLVSFYPHDVDLSLVFGLKKVYKVGLPVLLGLVEIPLVKEQFLGLMKIDSALFEHFFVRIINSKQTLERNQEDIRKG